MELLGALSSIVCINREVHEELFMTDRTKLTGYLVVELRGALQRRSGVSGTELKQTWKHRTTTHGSVSGHVCMKQKKKTEEQRSPVISYVEGVQALGEALHVVGADLLQEVYVIFRVEPTHVVLRGFVRLENLTVTEFRVKSLFGSSRESSFWTFRSVSPSSSYRGHSATPDCG